MSEIDLSSYIGLAALLLLTANILLGLLISIRNSPVKKLAPSQDQHLRPA